MYFCALPSPATTTAPQNSHSHKAATPNPAGHETPSTIHTRTIMGTVLPSATGQQLQTHLISTTGLCEGNHSLVSFCLILEFLAFPISTSQHAVGKTTNSITPEKHNMEQARKAASWDVSQNMKLSAEVCTDWQAVSWSRYEKTAQCCTFCTINVPWRGNKPTSCNFSIRTSPKDKSKEYKVVHRYGGGRDAAVP